ncbi:hypothetical protein EIN_459840 [Entamoeba invadens IP1]|uniref:Uncharacterized protein n=1 Tax=Entamoeba invadens IP1 TaxID=370355 RepID=L7FMA9_ENTIV|nr:hypothetical protein EIN_459840 [Entamoeba invadens IP1]ELP88613.1 hypothetical protein EIN_459840 [Entamoeba invadens IP1]|eukprot:XP_004255384.1 hypothetical protein EIN_459840 [Entamoeba invadens IP1]
MVKLEPIYLANVVLYLDSTTTFRNFTKISKQTIIAISMLHINPLKVLRYIPFLLHYIPNLETYEGNLMEAQNEITKDLFDQISWIDGSKFLFQMHFLKEEFAWKISALKINPSDLTNLCQLRQIRKVVFQGTIDFGQLEKIIEKYKLMTLKNVIVYLEDITELYLEKCIEFCAKNKEIFVGIAAKRSAISKEAFERKVVRNLKCVLFDFDKKIEIYNSPVLISKPENIKLKYDVLDSNVLAQIENETKNKNIETLHVDVALNSMDNISLFDIKAKRFELSVTSGKSLKFTNCKSPSDICVTTINCPINLNSLLSIKSLERVEVKGNYVLEKTTKEHFLVQFPHPLKSFVFHTKFPPNTNLDYSNSFKTLQKIELITPKEEIDLCNCCELKEIGITSISKTKCVLTLPYTKYTTPIYRYKHEWLYGSFKKTLFFKSETAKLEVTNVGFFTEIDIEGNIDKLDMRECANCQKLRLLSTAKETVVMPPTCYNYRSLFICSDNYPYILFNNRLNYIYVAKNLEICGNVKFNCKIGVEEIAFCVDEDTNLLIDSVFIEQITLLGLRRRRITERYTKNVETNKQLSDEVFEVAKNNTNIRIGKYKTAITKKTSDLNLYATLLRKKSKDSVSVKPQKDHKNKTIQITKSSHIQELLDDENYEDDFDDFEDEDDKDIKSN